ncbi:MAG: hypothetical protein NXI24_15090 [bacterium]|nr:hypothetical protein [bacterium]
MRILILTGIKEEITPFFSEHPFEFDRGLGAYQSTRYSGLYAATTGPGVKKSREIRRLLEKLVPHVIVNAGLVGLLRESSKARAGDRLRIGSVIDQRTGVVYPGGAGRDALVSVAQPVFEPSEKMDLALDHQAVACDMEAAVLLGIVGQIEEVATGSLVVLCKVVGDRPDSYNLFKYEHLVRGWERKKTWERLWLGVRFPGGPRRLRELLEMKSVALESLGRRLEALARTLAAANPDDPAQISRTLDSVFIPH